MLLFLIPKIVRAHFCRYPALPSILKTLKTLMFTFIDNPEKIMAIKVFGPASSICVQRVLLTLREKQLEYELIPVEMTKGEHKSPQYLEHQPFGVVPYLIDEDGFEIFESRAICAYLEIKYKNKGTKLIPSCDAKKMGTYEMGVSIEGGYFDGPASTIVFERLFKGILGYGPADETKVKAAADKLAGSLDVYEKILSKQEFIGGSEFSLADVFHLPYLSLFFAPQVEHSHLVWKDFL